MIAEERPHHGIAVGIVTPPHHRPGRAGWRLLIGRQHQRREGQRRRARQIARHEKPAGADHAECLMLFAAGLKMVGEQARRFDRRVFVGWSERIDCGNAL